MSTHNRSTVTAKRIATLATTAVASLLTMGIFTGPASAATREATRGDHCVIDVSARFADCYKTQQEADAAGLRVAHVANSKTAAADRRLRGAAPDSAQSAAAWDVVVGKYYDLPFYLSWAGTLRFWAPAGCTTTTADTDWVRDELASIGWNDRISSFESFSNCWSKLYEHEGFQGSTYGYAGSAWTLPGWMDNEASSITWS
jgi:hypothetical protein